MTANYIRRRESIWTRFPPGRGNFRKNTTRGRILCSCCTETCATWCRCARQDSTTFVPLDEFLFSALFGQRDLILHYDRGGLSFGNPAMQADFRRALDGYDSFHGTNYAQGGVPRNPDGVLNLLDNYLRLRIADGKKIALVIDFAETIAPAGDVSGMSAEDRNSLVILKRWARNAAFLRADVTICLIAENQIELNQGIVQNPGVSSIEIPLPDDAERLEFHPRTTEDKGLPAGSEVSDETLATLGAGLKRMQLQSLISHAVQNQQPLTLKFLSERKKDLIESESGGLLEFVQSRFDLSFVAGNDQAKRKLQDAAAAIRAGNTDVLPMGYVICGPVGTGKTFITTCFAGEVGIPAVTLKNFRSMWQGVTEGNLERVLNLLKAMSPIAVIVDEADAQLGDRSSSGDSGVGNRVFAQIAQFMGNTELPRQSDLVSADLPPRPVARRPEAAGPRRRAHRAVLSRHARRASGDAARHATENRDEAVPARCRKILPGARLEPVGRGH